MSDKAKRARAEANRRYREEHREEINAYRRKWAKENPEKVKKQKSRHFYNKAVEAEMEEDNADLVKAWERKKAEDPQIVVN